MERQMKLMSCALLLMAKDLCYFKNRGYEHPDNKNVEEMSRHYLELASTELNKQ